MNGASTPSYVAYDLDQSTAWQTVLKKIVSVESDNFAVYFDGDTASAAVDLKQDGLKQWMQDFAHNPGTRWIHFWTDQSQRPGIEALASMYQFSPRLVGLLCPETRRSPSTTTPQTSTRKSSRHRSTTFSKNAAAGDDVEADAGVSNSNSNSNSSSNGVGPKPSAASSHDITFGDVVDDLWHFHSVDFDRRYIYVGRNVLSAIPNTTYQSDKPAGQRLWSSIVLCRDGTVVSTLERPCLTGSSEAILSANKLVKRHILSIFAQLSNLNEVGSSSSILMTVRVRSKPAPSGSPQSKQGQGLENASLLFYYLFDDWMSTYALIARREHPYRDSLEQVRRDLTRAPDVQHLESLHNIGRQLGVLQLMYQSYSMIVTRILARYRKILPAAAVAPSLLRQFSDNARSEESRFEPTQSLDDFASPTPTPQSPLSQRRTRPRITSHDSNDLLDISSHTDQPYISDAALSRFERLLDRIHLYAMTEITQCMAEKESLGFMTFNLVGLSEQRTVEKLTRTAVLLAKVTIIFLPVSLLTAYFSIQVGDIAQMYSLKTYWLSFLLVTLVSAAFLLGFSFVTGKVEAQLLYQSLHRELWRRFTMARGGRGRSGRSDEKTL